MLLNSEMLIFGLVNLKMGFFNLEDKSRTGRPWSFDAAVIKDATESNPSISVRRLSAELGPSKSSIHRRFIELGKVNRQCREVPHELTQELMRRRIDICEKLLSYPKENPGKDKGLRD